MTTEATALPESPFIDEAIEEPIEEPIDEEIDEEEMEEPVDDEQDIDDEELDDEELEELLDDDDDEEDADEVQTVPHAALHKERERRKEIQAALQASTQREQELNAAIESYEGTIANIEKQLKELDLDDVIKLDRPQALSPEMLEMKAKQQQIEQQQQLENATASLRQEAAGLLNEYPMIDGNSAEQAEVIITNALASIMLGADPEDALHHSMKVMNDSLSSVKKAAIRKRKPVKKASSQRSVKRKAPARRKPTAGNVSGVFNDIAGNHLQKSPFE